MVQRIRQGLNTAWAGQNIVYLPVVDSTNRLARQLAAQGAEHGTLVLADAQTAGRGRRGRGWISSSGDGVFMSLILRPQMEASEVAQFSLLTAIAVARAIERTSALPARIKWPNDIVCSGRKLCGILLEMTTDEQGNLCVIAGVGINVHQTEFDEEIMHTASSIDLLSGKRQSRTALIRACLEEFEAIQAEVGTGDGKWMNAYRTLSATIGQNVQVIAINETFTGIAKDVTQSGLLLVEDEAGRLREVLAGDVSVRGLMGYV